MKKVALVIIPVIVVIVGVLGYISYAKNRMINQKYEEYIDNGVYISAETEEDTNTDESTILVEESSEITEQSSIITGGDLYPDAVSSEHEKFDGVVAGNIDWGDADDFQFYEQWWFSYSDKDMGVVPSVLSAVAYTIYTYYKGDVPTIYEFSYDDDLITAYTNMIAEYQVKPVDNEYATLDITINFYRKLIDVSTVDHIAIANKIVEQLESETELEIVDTYKYDVDMDDDSFAANGYSSAFIDNVYKVYGYVYTSVTGVREYTDDNVITGTVLFDNGMEYADFSLYEDGMYAMLYAGSEYINDSDSIKDLASTE
jgi:hypothetical protein